MFASNNMLSVSYDNCILGNRFIKVIGLPPKSYLLNVRIYAVYSFVFVCYYANEIKFITGNLEIISDSRIRSVLARVLNIGFLLK